MKCSRTQIGQATIETVLLGLLFLVPLIWSLGVLSDLHRSALALTAAAREGGAAATRGMHVGSAELDLVVAVRQALRDHGLDQEKVQVDWSGSPTARGQAVRVTVRYPVTVLQAPFLGRVSNGPAIWVTAVHIARVDRYASRR